jgi:hypothetical protein
VQLAAMPGLNGLRQTDPEVLRARQERRDHISRLMAEYMLKGYKMLDAYCNECTVRYSIFNKLSTFAFEFSIQIPLNPKSFETLIVILMDEIIKLILFPEHSARKSHGRIVLRSLS